jgi:hypothetical protein
VEHRPRIKPRMHEWMTAYSFIREIIRGWCLGAANFNALRELQSASGEELPPSLHFGDYRCFARRSQSALMPSVLDRAFKGEL